jgi:hypothetical protein
MEVWSEILQQEVQSLSFKVSSRRAKRLERCVFACQCHAAAIWTAAARHERPPLTPNEPITGVLNPAEPSPITNCRTLFTQLAAAITTATYLLEEDVKAELESYHHSLHEMLTAKDLQVFTCHGVSKWHYLMSHT